MNLTLAWVEFDTAENRLRNKYTSAAGGLAEAHSSASPLCQIGHAFLLIRPIHCQMAKSTLTYVVW